MSRFPALNSSKFQNLKIDFFTYFCNLCEKMWFKSNLIEMMLLMLDELPIIWFCCSVANFLLKIQLALYKETKKGRGFDHSAHWGFNGSTAGQSRFSIRCASSKTRRPSTARRHVFYQQSETRKTNKKDSICYTLKYQTTCQRPYTSLHHTFLCVSKCFIKHIYS